MRRTRRIVATVAACVVLAGAGLAAAQDWPQWRGPNRDGKAAGFVAPATWPTALTEVWKVAVGEGDATPALVGDKLYVFSREGAEEVIRCLDLKEKKELWKDKYGAPGFTGADRAHQGPRATPAVADGKVVTFGVNGVLSCLDAEKGTVLWRNDKITGTPRFHTAASPLIVDGMVIAYLGPPAGGALFAFDLATGNEKWKWDGEGPDYGSPVLMTVEGVKQAVTLSAKSVVGVAVADGKLCWKVDFPISGMGYNADTPIVDGQTVIYSGTGRGTRAVKIERKEGAFVAAPLWSNPDVSIQFSAPVLKDGLVFGLTQQGRLFCLDAKDGKTAWQDTTVHGSGGGGRRGGRGGAMSNDADTFLTIGMGGGGMGGGAPAGYAGLVDAGPVLVALPPTGNLVVFKPSAAKYEEVAKIKVADPPVYAQPVLAGSRIIVKAANSIIVYAFPAAPPAAA